MTVGSSLSSAYSSYGSSSVNSQSSASGMSSAHSQSGASGMSSSQNFGNVMSQMATSLMSSIDSNKDGSIDKSEFQQAVDSKSAHVHHVRRQYLRRDDDQPHQFHR